MNTDKSALCLAAIFAAMGFSLANFANAAVLDLSGAPNYRNTQENATNTSPKAFDGNTGTRWATTNTTGDNAWIWVDLGADYALQSVAIMWEAADANTYKLYKLSSAEATSIGWSGGTFASPNTATPTYAGPTNPWIEIASVANARDANSGQTDIFNFVTQTVTVSNRTGADPGGLTTSIPNATPLTRYLLINAISDFDINGGTSIYEVTVDANLVPEPSTLALVGLASIGLLLRRQR